MLIGAVEMGHLINVDSSLIFENIYPLCFRYSKMGPQ